MSGRTHLTPSATLQEIPIFVFDEATREGLAGVDPGDAGFAARYRRQGETTDTTMTLTAVAANAAIAANQWREYGDGWYSLVGPAGLYATGARFAKVTLDVGLTGALADSVMVFLGPDPLGPVATESGIATATATAVDAQLADNFAAVPAAVVGELAGAGGAAARTAIAARVYDLPVQLASTPTGSGTELIAVQIDTGSGMTTVGTARFINGRLDRIL